MLNWYWAEDDVRDVVWPERHRDYLSDTPLVRMWVPRMLSVLDTGSRTLLVLKVGSQNMSRVRSVTVTLWSGLAAGSVAAIIFLALVNPLASQTVNGSAIAAVISIGVVIGAVSVRRINTMVAQASAELGA